MTDTETKIKAYVLRVAAFNEDNEHMFTDVITHVSNDDAGKKVLQYFVDNMCPFEDMGGTFRYFINEEDVDLPKSKLQSNLNFLLNEIKKHESKK